MKKHLIIPTSIDLVRIAPDKIVYIASDGNYSTLVQTDNEMRMLSYQLGQIEKMISSQLGSDGNVFIRIGKSLIINSSYIYYIKFDAGRHHSDAIVRLYRTVEHANVYYDAKI